MKRNIKTLTLLLFAAATMLTFASCSKDIEESQIIGKWQFPTDVGVSYLRNGTMDIKSDHTITFQASSGKITFDWTLESDHFTAVKYFSTSSAVMQFDITDISATSMTIEGDYVVMGDNEGSVSGTLTKVE